MDRRSFLALSTASAGALAVGLPGTAQAQTGPLWAADLRTARDSYGAGFGNVQIQYGGESIRNNGPGIPVVDHPRLGRALRIGLERNQMRWEARPGAATSIREGEDYYFRVDFALDRAFPVNQSDPFCVINQIHQGANTGSPPVEFDIVSGHLQVRGDSTAYTRRLVPVSVDTVYRLVYRVVFSASSNRSLLEVWVNGTTVLSGFRTPNPTIRGGNSYWKGATMYCRASLSPLTVFQNNHRVGRSYASVAP